MLMEIQDKTACAGVYFSVLSGKKVCRIRKGTGTRQGKMPALLLHGKIRLNGDQFVIHRSDTDFFGMLQSGAPIRVGMHIVKLVFPLHVLVRVAFG